MVYRLALFIVLFVLLAAYILRLGAQGKISGRFRIVSLLLLSLLLGLSGLGYYSSKQQSVDTLQGKFSAQKDSILEEIQELQKQKEYQQARELADKYLSQVQDPVLERLRRQNRRLELENRLQTQDLEARDQLEIYQELAELTQEPRYGLLWQEQKQKILKKQEQRLQQHLEKIPRSSLAQRLLAYQELLRINPEQKTYQQQGDRLQQAVDSRIQDSHWSNVCGRESTDYCGHIGWLAYEAAAGERSEQVLGEVLGLTWRPRGTLISRDGERAPENSYYYIIYDWRKQRTFLRQVDYVRPQKNLPDQAELNP
ncbi:MAG: hypothetical protein ACLFMQ_02855 [Desulfohalobiaceae bacterium]